MPKHGAQNRLHAETWCSKYRDFVPKHHAQNNYRDYMLKKM